MVHTTSTSVCFSASSTFFEAHATSAVPHSPPQLRLALQESASDEPLAASAAKATWERLAATLSTRLRWPVNRLEVVLHDSDTSCTSFACNVGDAANRAVVTQTVVARDRFIAMLSPTHDAPAPRECLAVHAHFERSSPTGGAEAAAQLHAPDVREAEAVLRRALAPGRHGRAFFYHPR